MSSIYKKRPITERSELTAGNLAETHNHASLQDDLRTITETHNRAKTHKHAETHNRTQ
jgi:hypothetical protein